MHTDQGALTFRLSYPFCWLLIMRLFVLNRNKYSSFLVRCIILSAAILVTEKGMEVWRGMVRSKPSTAQSSSLHPWILSSLDNTLVLMIVSLGDGRVGQQAAVDRGVVHWWKINGSVGRSQRSPVGCSGHQDHTHGVGVTWAWAPAGQHDDNIALFEEAPGLTCR